MGQLNLFFAYASMAAEEIQWKILPTQFKVDLTHFASQRGLKTELSIAYCSSVIAIQLNGNLDILT